MKNIFIIVCVLFLMGCDKKQPSIPTNVTDPVVVMDTFGNKYVCVSNEMTLPNGQLQVALWKRIEPLDTNRWYTPTLASRLDTNNPPMFNPILK